MFRLEELGRYGDGDEFKVDAARVAAYAAATNDDHPRHASGELAPPVFAVVPVWGAMGAAVAAVTPPEVLMRVVHGDQDIHITRPIVAGDVLRSAAAPVGVQARGTGTTLVVRSETTDAAGELVNEQFFTLFFRGVSDGPSGGEEAPGHKLTAEAKAAGPFASVEYRFDADQTFRYAEASGDHMPIHLDDGVARSVGLPGIIIHGLCTMAFTGRAVVAQACASDPARLRRLAVRFSRPAQPGQGLAVRLYQAGAGVVGFEALNDEGQAVVKDGLAEIGF